MKGLDAEFTRFSEQALEPTPGADIENTKLIFMAGALAASQRILDIIYSGLPDKKRAALLRRVERECFAFQQAIIGKAKEAK